MEQECPKCGLVVSPEERERCQSCRAPDVKELVADLLKRIGFGMEMEAGDGNG